MRRYFAVVLALAFWCAVPGVSPASGQQVSSFEQLQLLVKPGDTIEVLGVDGIKTKGKIENLTPTTLRMNTKAGFHDFAQKDALQIRQKRGDSLSNGAWIGAASGGGLLGVGAIIVCSVDECSGGAAEIAGAIVVYTGIGAAIGVGIDAMLKHYQTIYRQPAQNALKSIGVAPLLANGRKGAMVRFSF